MNPKYHTQEISNILKSLFCRKEEHSEQQI